MSRLCRAVRGFGVVSGGITVIVDSFPITPGDWLSIGDDYRHSRPFLRYIISYERFALAR